VAATLLIGFAGSGYGGYLLGRSDSETRVLSSAAPVEPKVTSHARRAESRESFATARPATHPVVESPVRAKELEQLRAGNDVIDRALASGHWTDTDVESLDTATEGLGGAERAQLLMRVAAATNADRLQIDTMIYP